MQIASLKFSISAQVTNRTWWTKSPAQNTPFSILLKKMRWPAICLEFNQKYKARFNEGVFDPLTKKNRKNKQYASNDKLETVQSLDQKKNCPNERPKEKNCPNQDYPIFVFLGLILPTKDTCRNLSWKPTVNHSSSSL